MRKFQNISCTVIILSSVLMAFEAKAMENSDEVGQKESVSFYPKVEKSEKDKPKEKHRKRSFTSTSISSSSRSRSFDEKSEDFQDLSVERLKKIREELNSNLSSNKKEYHFGQLASSFFEESFENSESARLIFLESFCESGKLYSFSEMDWIFCQDGEFSIDGDYGRYTHSDQNQFWETLVKVLENPGHAENKLSFVQPESWTSENIDIKHLKKKAKKMIRTLMYTVEELEEFWPEESESSLFKFVRTFIKENPQKQYSIDAAFNIYCNALKRNPPYRSAIDWIEEMYLKTSEGWFENYDGTRRFLQEINFYLKNQDADYWDKDENLVNYVSEDQRQVYKKHEGRFRVVGAAHAYHSFLKYCNLSDIARWILPYVDPSEFTPRAKETIKLLKTVEKNKEKRGQEKNNKNS